MPSEYSGSVAPELQTAKLVFRPGVPEYSNFPPPLVQTEFTLEGNAEFHDRSDSAKAISLPTALSFYRASNWAGFSDAFMCDQNILVKVLGGEVTAELHQTFRQVESPDNAGVLWICYTHVDPAVFIAAVRLVDRHYDWLQQLANNPSTCVDDLPQIVLEPFRFDLAEKCRECADLDCADFWEGFPAFFDGYRIDLPKSSDSDTLT
jgi:hypothetical protein